MVADPQDPDPPQPTRPPAPAGALAADLLAAAPGQLADIDLASGLLALAELAG